MNRFNKIAHVVWECKYHLIWCPKYRYKELDNGVRRTVDESLESLCKWKKIEILEKNVQLDHVHLVLSFPPKYSISEIVGYLKGKSAIRVFNRHDKMKRRYWGRHFWAQGYCVSTVGIDEEKIRKYVRWQLERDRRMDQLEMLDN